MTGGSWSVLAVAMLIALPSAFAAWGGKGGFEPDTSYDETAMWSGPDVSPNPNTRLVYFNGFSGAAPGVGTSVNPNLAGAQSSLLATQFYPVAILGVWKDCNGDGYIGLGDNGALEYPAFLLANTSICRPQPGALPGTEHEIHNDGRWVQELTPIGYDDVRSEPMGGDTDPRNYNDTSARVWADWGPPGGAPSPPCPLTSMHRGTLHSTGGLLVWADCHTAYYGTRTISDVAQAAGRPELGFSDAPPDEADRSESALNRQNPYGEGDDDAMFMAFDCSQPAHAIDVLDPTSGGLHAVTVGGMTITLTDSEDRFFHTEVYPPGMSSPAEGSLAGTLNETEAGATDCDRGNEGEIVDLDGKPAGSDADLPYFLEGSTRAPSRFAPRTQSDFVLAFEEGDRRAGAAFLTGRWSSDGNTGAFAITGLWSGMSATRVGPAVYLNRNDPGLAPPQLVTYYAWVSPVLVQTSGLQLPSGAGGQYGAETCLDAFPAFECDPARWWRDDEGNDAMPRDARLGSEPGAPTIPRLHPSTELGRRVGDAYALRDVDCIDFSASPAREAGAHWGAATGTAC